MTTETPTNISVFLRFKQVSQVAMLGGSITRVELELGGKPLYFDVPVSQQEAFMETLRQEMGQHGLVPPPDIRGCFNDWGDLYMSEKKPEVGTIQENPEYALYRLQSFLYELMRDAAPIGEVERVLRNVMCEDPPVRYTNQFLANYAMEVAGTIVSSPKQVREKAVQKAPPAAREYDEFANIHNIGDVKEALRKAEADPNYVAISSPVRVERMSKRKDSHCKEGCKCSRKQKEVDDEFPFYWEYPAGTTVSVESFAVIYENSVPNPTLQLKLATKACKHPLRLSMSVEHFRLDIESAAYVQRLAIQPNYHDEAGSCTVTCSGLELPIRSLAVSKKGEGLICLRAGGKRLERTYLLSIHVDDARALAAELAEQAAARIAKSARTSTEQAQKAKDALNELFAKDPTKLKKEHELCLEMLKEAEKNVAKEVADKAEKELGEAMRKEETYVPLRIHRFVLRHGTIPMLHIFSKDSRGEEAGLTLDNNVQDFIDACIAASNAQQVSLQIVASATPLEEVTHCVNKPLTLQLREVATPMGPSITLLRVGFGTHGASYIFRASPKGYLALVNIIEEQVAQKNWKDIEKESQKDSE